MFQVDSLELEVDNIEKNITSDNLSFYLYLGGGASDVRLSSSTTAYSSRIVVAGGGMSFPHPQMHSISYVFCRWRWIG